ncbi:MAG: AAA domain-containing protein [Gammaproteobacteria bacterium]|nr:AAA domain-containing protein [Gammaproteobacteria bacterium]MDE0479160.1 AAA domain-containing protein [Gammaproteobacteria bacterium]MDE0508882.1 AAA domain-containing protein [Gammaproteobacteria bacterium]
MPEDLRHIPLRYAGHCKSCSKKLKQGIRAYWSPSASKIWCEACVKHVSREAQPAVAGKIESAPEIESVGRRLENGDKVSGMVVERTPWQQLCDYALSCVEGEAAETLIDFELRDKRWFSHNGTEKLVIGHEDSIGAPAGLDGKLEKRKKSVVYGWPTVVIRGRDKKAKVAPLFALQIEAERNEENSVMLHAVMEPEFNLAVAASGVFDPSAMEEVKELMLDGLPFGDAIAFEELSREIAIVLGLKIHSKPDGGRLASDFTREQGIHNAAISVLAEWTGYTATLRDELKELRSRSDWQLTAAAHLFSNIENENRTNKGPLAAPLPCNQSQEEMLAKIRTESLTVVTGPPGTGKTQLVVNAVTNAWLDGDKVLVTSTNNGAVDVAVKRAAKDVGIGLLIRTGNRDKREEVPDRITMAIAETKNHTGNQASARARLRQAVNARNALLENQERLENLDTLLLRSSESRKELEREAKKASRRLWLEPGPPTLKMDYASIGKKASQLSRAWILRGWRSGIFRRRLGCIVDAELQTIALWADISARISELRVDIDSCRDERTRIAGELGDVGENLQEADNEWSSASRDAVRAEVTARIREVPQALAEFAQSSAQGGRLKRIISNSLPHLRGWACTALTAQNNFPLEPDLFDLVIIDEASQCSLATMLPLAYRAKRLAVVGDPHQLNPIVAIGDGHLREIARQAGLNNDRLRERGIHYKDGSAYSAFEHALKPATPMMLNEHYRCHPHIARWFNRMFYADALTVLTDVSNTSAQDRAVGWVDIEGEAERPSSGSWINRLEAEQSVRQIEAELKAGCGSLGIVTPFQAQARLIRNLAERRFSLEALNEIDFMSGTAHRLQGDERDTIVFSAVVTPNMPPKSIRWIEKEKNLLNVAVSRAKSKLVVIGHPNIEKLGGSILASLHSYIQNEVSSERTVESSFASFRTDSEAESLLLEALQINNFCPYAKINVEGYELDFALLERGIKLNIEVDGDQHIDARDRRCRQDITRDRVLAKLGWMVRRIPAWRCHEEIDLVIEEIDCERDRLLKQRGIKATHNDEDVG